MKQCNTLGVLIILVIVSCSSVNQDSININGVYRNKDSFFNVTQDSLFNYKSEFIFNSDVKTIFLDGWSSGQIVIRNQNYYLNSSKPKLDFNINKIEILNKRELKVEFYEIKNYVKLYLVNENNNNKIEIKSENPVINIYNGRYHFEVYPNRDIIEGMMNINQEFISSNSFIIEAEDKSYTFDLNFDINLFSYVIFDNLLINFQKEYLIYKKNKFLKSQ